MKKLNLTELSLQNKSLVWYFVLVVFVMGAWSYMKLGRMEDPDFVIRQMIVSTAWPGATARQIEEQVTDKIEKKLQDTPGLDYLKSYSRPGLSVVYVTLREDIASEKIRPTWLEVRNLVGDMRGDLPEGVSGPFFNDRFDDVFGSIYALTGDGFSYEELRREAEKIRRVLLSVDSVRKVELVGEQTEKIYVEVENSKLAELGIDPNLIAASIKAQNAVTPAGMVETASDNVYLRVSGKLGDLDALRALPIHAGGRTLRLGDIARISREYAQPSDPRMFFNGQPAIGIAVSMEEGGNILTLGESLRQTVESVKQSLPLGLEIWQVSDQPQVVEASIGDFVSSLREAVVIVLFVSFLSLGLRTGMVVALCIPLVIAGVFLAMEILGIDLHKVSLGALILSLGLLVDDAIITVEMMAVKLEEGYERFQAACYAYTATAIPMLTGTLITCAGFIPVGFSKGMAAEFTKALFPVIVLALLISWTVSVMVAPLLGYKLIRVKERPEQVRKKAYDSRFYTGFRSALVWCLRHRAAVLGAALACFLLSIFALRFVKQDFFPPSVRPEIIVEMTLPEGASMQATQAQAQRLAAFLDASAGVKNYSYYVGEGAPRFVLTTEPVLPADNYAQFIVVAEDIAARIALAGQIQTAFAEEFANVRGNLKLIQTGPPAPYPVMLRVSGYEIEKVRQIAQEVAQIVEEDPQTRQTNFDWNEKNKVMRLDVDQSKLRALGISGQSLALTLQTQLSGAAVAEFYDGDRTVDITLRIAPETRLHLEKVKELPVYLPSGVSVPLQQVAKIRYDAEEGLIWRRDLKPAITVRAGIGANVTANDVANRVYAATAALRAALPPGYSVEPDGAVENSAKAMRFMLVPVPVMMLAIVTLLMLQFKRMPLMFLTVLTAPLGVIGVTLGMLLADQPMGFVAQLGILALSGMIIRNSVILIEQIEMFLAAGEAHWTAVIDAAIMRFRPIMLTALTSILGMVPLMGSNFWGPMAVAIAGGLFVATALTLLVLPTMYAAWFKVREEIK